MRVCWKIYRFAVKVVNNLFTNFSRFLIFAFGGYLAVQGNLELGALVAFLSAQEKLYDPWKELLRFYQALQTARVTYQRTMDYFDIPPETFYAPEKGTFERLNGAMEVQNISFVTKEDHTLLRGVSFSLEAGEHMALVGFSGSGKSTLAHCMIRLLPYSEGNILLDGKPIGEMAPQSVVANLGFVSQDPLVFRGTVEENLLYGCTALPDEVEKPRLDDRIEVLQQAGLYMDVLNIGHRQRLEPDGRDELKKTILKVRARFHQEFGKHLADDIEHFDQEAYLEHGSVAENIRFGCPCDEGFSDERIGGQPVFVKVLRQSDLYEMLVELGAELAEEILDIFGSLPPDVVATYGVPMDPQEMETYRRIEERNRRLGKTALKQEDRQKLLVLALRFAPAQHKVLVLRDEIRESILRARSAFRESMEKTDPDAVVFYGDTAYAEGLPILNNIIFCRLTSKSERVHDRVYRRVNALLVKEALLEQIIEIGMQFEVGSGGENLSGGQRQKLAIARALLKNPAILIMDEATANLDNRSQARFQEMLQSRWKGKSTLVSVVHRMDIIENYDKIGVMKEGRIEEIGTYDELMEKKGVLHELIHGK